MAAVGHRGEGCQGRARARIAGRKRRRFGMAGGCKGGAQEAVSDATKLRQSPKASTVPPVVHACCRLVAWLRPQLQGLPRSGKASKPACPHRSRSHRSGPLWTEHWDTL